MNKLIDNIGLQAIKALGLRQVLTVYWNFLLNIIQIFKYKNLIPLDKSMSNINKLFIQHRLGSFKININHIDTKIDEQNSYAFSAVRELYIRDCYFKYHKEINSQDIKVVVDLGANRGLFSTLCSCFCEKIIAVEAQEHYNDIIEYNLKYNNFTNYKIVNKFIGIEGKLNNKKISNFITFDELLEQYNIEYIDFLKIDIEGSEFTLFDEDLPLDRIHYISMEIHPQFGDVETIIQKLRSFNFNVITTTSDFQITDHNRYVDYLYAENTTF